MKFHTASSLRHRREAHAAPIFSPFVASQRKFSRFSTAQRARINCARRAARTVLLQKTRPARDHLEAVLIAAAVFAFYPKGLSHLTPVAARDASIRTGDDLAAKHLAMSLLHMFIRLPGAPIRLLIFKEQFQFRRI